MATCSVPRTSSRGFTRVPDRRYVWFHPLVTAVISPALRQRGLAGSLEAFCPYLRRKGEIGLVNKIRAYSLQDGGLDTVDANLALGFRDDERDYAVAAHMLASLTVAWFVSLTNNSTQGRTARAPWHPSRVAFLTSSWPTSTTGSRILETKANRRDTTSTSRGASTLAEQDDPVVVEEGGALGQVL